MDKAGQQVDVDRRPILPAAGSAPTIEIAIPVYNEAVDLLQQVERLVAYLRATFPFTYRITIVDNGSTDPSWEVATKLAATFDEVEALHLDQKGRGRALRASWSASQSPVLAYMDVDLSTDLDALFPLIAPLISGHSDIAIGTRLTSGASVARRPKREIISRGYNAMLHTMFGTNVSDAQCGFKAIRNDVAQMLLPRIVDNAWFFDSEMLLLAERNGLRIHEVAVDWIDDPDSRVNIVNTAREDVAGAVRLLRDFATGRGRIDFSSVARPPLEDDYGRHWAAAGLRAGTALGVVGASYAATRGLASAIRRSLLNTQKDESTP